MSQENKGFIDQIIDWLSGKSSETNVADEKQPGTTGKRGNPEKPGNPASPSSDSTQAQSSENSYIPEYSPWQEYMNDSIKLTQNKLIKTQAEFAENINNIQKDIDENKTRQRNNFLFSWGLGLILFAFVTIGFPFWLIKSQPTNTLTLEPGVTATETSTLTATPRLSVLTPTATVFTATPLTATTTPTFTPAPPCDPTAYSEKIKLVIMSLGTATKQDSPGNTKIDVHWKLQNIGNCKLQIADLTKKTSDKIPGKNKKTPTISITTNSTQIQEDDLLLIANQQPQSLKTYKKEFIWLPGEEIEIVHIVYYNKGTGTTLDRDILINIVTEAGTPVSPIVISLAKGIALPDPQ